MANNDTRDIELEPTKQTWDKDIETRGEDSCRSKIVTVEVDSLMPSKGARVPHVDTDLEAGKQAMTEEAEMARRRRWSRSVLISKVRDQVRAGDVNSYTPHSVSIGPYHASCSSPRIEKEKLCCVGFFQSLSEDQIKGGLTGLAEKLEPLARACYPDGVGHMTPEELSTMLLRDGCFLLACMVDYQRGNNADKKLAHSSTGKDGDPAQTVGGDVQDGGSFSGGDNNTVVRDTVFLVENQIPFFVLQKIHERVTGDTTSSALESIADYVQEVLQPTSPPPAMEENAARPRTGRWRRATEYCKYGNVRFKRQVFQDNEKWTFLDVRLQGGTLWVPRLRVDGMTWTVLRNLMALEEQISRRPVTAYCLFMSQVAGTVEDVKLLVHSGIVEHFLASDEQVAQGFADLCKGVVMDVDNIDRNYLMPMWHEMQERCENRVHRFMGWFCQFKNIVIIIVLLVALIIIACQVTQTFYAVSSSRGGQPPKH
ncbi:UPF0481 protein At3g47200 isoform X2 [Setaria viridis]|uniref:UPF0481 protein At3g47200 isoform X2 n=1 Tax=Setaria viridis TaxID=4556 RepID=UPI00149330E3|nr:uncharacterized protein LOC117845514 isoform X2 [Setaria viridis]